MVTRTQKIKLGVFLMVVAGVVVALVVLFAGLSVEERIPYYLDVPNAIGLNEGAPVTMRGVRIGEVEEITLRAEGFEHVKVRVGILENIRIEADATAYLETEGVGVSGLKFVNIMGGTPEGPELSPGSKIPLGKTRIERFAEEGELLVDRAEELFAETEELINTLTAVAEAVEPERVQQIVGRVERTTEELEGLVRENRRTLNRTTRQAERTFERASETLAEIEALTSDVRGVVRRNSDTLQASLRNLRDASQDFEQLARELRDQPSRAVFGRPPKERELP